MSALSFINRVEEMTGLPCGITIALGVDSTNILHCISYFQLKAFLSAQIHVLSNGSVFIFLQELFKTK